MTYRDSLTSEGVFYSCNYALMHLQTRAFALQKWDYVIRHAYLQSIYIASFPARLPPCFIKQVSWGRGLERRLMFTQLQKQKKGHGAIKPVALYDRLPSRQPTSSTRPSLIRPTLPQLLQKGLGRETRVGCATCTAQPWYHVGMSHAGKKVGLASQFLQATPTR